MTDKRVTVDFDSESYYLDGKYWESWDNFGEEMADKINELLNELNEENQGLKNDCGILVQSNQDYRKENEQLQEKNKRLEEKIQRERTASTKQHLKWSKEAETKIKELSEENERLRRCINEIYLISSRESIE